jgi:predicted MFS family arabinose efflux permease
MPPGEKEGPATVFSLAMLTNPVSITGVISPLVIGAFVDGGRVSVEWASRLGATEFGGMTLTLLVAPALLSGRLGLRSLAGFGLIGAIIAEFASATVDRTGILLLLRALVGSGVGMAYAAGISALAQTKVPAKSFGVSFISNQTAGIVLLAILPWIGITWGGRATFIGLAVFLLITLLFVPLIPRRLTVLQTVSSERNTSDRPYAAYGGVVATFMLSLGFGMSWPLAGQLAATRGLTPAAIGSAFAMSGFAGLGGAVTATVLASRVPRLGLVLGGAAAMAFSVWAVGIESLPLTATLLLVMFCFVFCIPNFFAVLAAADGSGRLASVNGAMIPMGIAAGQLATALILPAAGLRAMLPIASIAAVVALLIQLWVGLHLHDTAKAVLSKSPGR